MTTRYVYYYDGNGQRVRKVTTGGVTKYYYTGSSVLVTLDESNNKTSENIVSTGGDIIAGKRFEGLYTDKWYFYDYDLRGSVTSILDPDGAYTSGYQYDAFGNTTQKGDSDFKNEMEFTGCIADKSSGLYYMNSRYYNPSTGRFLTQDAAGGDAWTNNLYAYCGNNPVNFIDPTGYTPVIYDEEWEKKQHNGGYTDGGTRENRSLYRNLNRIGHRQRKMLYLLCLDIILMEAVHSKYQTAVLISQI